MTDFSKKTSIAKNLANAMQYQNAVAGVQTGWQLPCTVVAVDAIKGFVTVNFEVVNTTLPLPQITIPVAGWRYIRYPIQVGDAGFTITIDTNISNLAGLADGKTSMVAYGNFGPTLAFLPVMQKGMANSDNPQAVVVVGPEGAIIRDDNSNSVVTISPSQIKLQSGSSYITINHNGSIDIEGTSVTIMGKDFIGHHHSGVQTGTSNTGGVS